MKFLVWIKLKIWGHLRSIFEFRVGSYIPRFLYIIMTSLTQACRKKRSRCHHRSFEGKNFKNISAFLEHFLPSVPRRNPSVSQEHVFLELAQVHLSSQPPLSVSHGFAWPISARFSLAEISRLNSNRNDCHNLCYEKKSTFSGLRN